MRRPLVTALALVLALLAPAPAWAQQSDTPTVSGSPSPSPTPSNCAGTGGILPVISPQQITAGEEVTLSITWTGPLTNTFAQVRPGHRWATPTTKAAPEWTDGTPAATPIRDVPEGETERQTYTLRPTTNTRLDVAFGYRTGCLFADGFLYGPRSVIDVAPRLTLDAVRTGVRSYRFSGTATRPGQVLSLYRVTADGSQALTAQTRATDARTWSLRRTFLGSGRFGFVLRTGRDMANAPGASNVRPTVIH